MLQKFSADDVVSLVPSRFINRLTKSRPRKVKTVQNVGFSSIIQPNTCKSIERYLTLHATRGYTNRRPVSNTAIYPPASPFPFQQFYTIKGLFERSKAAASVDFMLAKAVVPVTQLVVHMFIEALWFSDSNWLNIIKEKMRQFHIAHFRAPAAIISALRLNRPEVADELIKYSEPGGLKDVAHALVESKNMSYLQNIIPKLNISNRNDVLFQGLSRLYRTPGYEPMWEFLTSWANPYKVVSKMLYMRECPPADYLLSQKYLHEDVLNEAWRYVIKTGLEHDMPRATARRLNTKIYEQLSDVISKKVKGARGRKM